MAGYMDPVHIPGPVPSGARRILKVGWGILAAEIVGVGVVVPMLLPLNYALAAVLLIELPFGAAWVFVMRSITRKRFGVALPRFENE